jgi:hypothetical protein
VFFAVALALGARINWEFASMIGVYGLASMASLWPSKTAFAVNGPTTGARYDGTLPPFSWSEFPNTPHQGLFDTYNLCVSPGTPPPPLSTLHKLLLSPLPLHAPPLPRASNSTRAATLRRCARRGRRGLGPG